ncbi:hypothetical protein G3480_02790 [Thiorhodococcus mannitoliphagus]|uniref:LSDAT prokaryote domain-containing protein n=1 Tax=Thiorhodococcus mannitoliphagus TaxID=329406 RepID=A0A6P1DMH5_9GAMM|nr:hypothetical protein [Thiorhodococcus mannitoliphagus]NEX19248.1 hypothetical protein [Thiorhodococcus mannitoliphagus]
MAVIAAEQGPARIALSEVLHEALSEIALAPGHPVLVMVGGASNIAPRVASRLLAVLECVAPVLDDMGALVVDGGTAFGVMAAMGQARLSCRARFPLIGVAAIGTVAPDSRPQQARCACVLGAHALAAQGGATLDPNHSHFLLVPGERWGDESPWIQAVAQALALRRGSLTLVAAGGDITRLDVACSLAAARPCVVLGGSGGTSDLLAAWVRGEIGPPGPELADADHSLLRIVDLDDAAETLPCLLRDELEREAGA